MYICNFNKYKNIIHTNRARAMRRCPFLEAIFTFTVNDDEHEY